MVDDLNGAAPGLVWRKRKAGWAATWQARTDLVNRGYRPKSVLIWKGDALSEAERILIMSRCRKNQDEMLMWSRSPNSPPSRSEPRSGVFSPIAQAIKRGAGGGGDSIEWISQHANYEADDCLIFPFYRGIDGYGRAVFLGTSYYVHTLMCEIAHGARPKGYEVAHSCGNGHLGCANPRHLSWKTKSANRRDSNLHGTGARNMNGNKGRLTPDQVKEIRDLKGKKTQSEIAAMFGISAPSVRSIFTGKMYARV